MVVRVSMSDGSLQASLSWGGGKMARFSPRHAPGTPGLRGQGVPQGPQLSAAGLHLRMAMAGDTYFDLHMRDNRLLSQPLWPWAAKASRMDSSRLRGLHLPVPIHQPFTKHSPMPTCSAMARLRPGRAPRMWSTRMAFSLEGGSAQFRQGACSQVMLHRCSV